jgi:hypothetical protein
MMMMMTFPIPNRNWDPFIGSFQSLNFIFYLSKQIYFRINFGVVQYLFQFCDTHNKQQIQSQGTLLLEHLNIEISKSPLISIDNYWFHNFSIISYKSWTLKETPLFT